MKSWGKAFSIHPKAAQSSSHRIAAKGPFTGLGFDPLPLLSLGASGGLRGLSPPPKIDQVGRGLVLRHRRERKWFPSPFPLSLPGHC